MFAYCLCLFLCSSLLCFFVVVVVVLFGMFVWFLFGWMVVVGWLFLFCFLFVCFIVDGGVSFLGVGVGCVGRLLMLNNLTSVRIDYS